MSAKAEYVAREIADVDSPSTERNIMEAGAGDATWLRQESSGNTSGKRLAAFACTAGHGYTYGRTLTPNSKSGSRSRSPICTLACMASAAARTKCRRASTVTRIRAGGASNNFGNGFGSGYLARRKAPSLGAGGSTRKV